MQQIRRTSPLGATRGQAVLPLGYALFGVIPLSLGAVLITVGMVTGKRHHRRWPCTTGYKDIPRGFRLGGMVYRYQTPMGGGSRASLRLPRPRSTRRDQCRCCTTRRLPYSVADSVLHRGLLSVIAGAVFVVLGVGTVTLLLLLAALPAPVVVG